MTVNIIQIYKKYYIDRDYEQIDLFRNLKNTFHIDCVVYPGSYVHISPSFIFSRVAFIDSDKKANKFFNDDEVEKYISIRKEYENTSEISFYAGDYRKLIVELSGKFDLLISQYAGFISDSCKDYLRIGGYLLVNNSHGDAGLASIDKDYELVAAVMKRKGQYHLSFSKLDEYFIPKKALVVTREYLYEIGKGVGYTKTAPLYIFHRKS